MKTKQNFFSDNLEISQQLNPKRMGELFAWLSEEEKTEMGVNTPEEFSKNWFDILQVLGEYAGTTL